MIGQSDPTFNIYPFKFKSTWSLLQLVNTLNIGFCDGIHKMRDEFREKTALC